MISTDLPKTEMVHYRFSQPTENGKKGQDSTQLTVTAAFGSKQITFVRSEARACTVSANNVHIGWNAYDRIPGRVPPVTVRSGYEEGQRLDTCIPGMGAHQRRHIPMATVPKNGLICLTSFTDEKFPGLQRAPQTTTTTTTEVFKTRTPPAGNTGINPYRSTSCHLVRDRFRRDLKKGQKILWANERLDNLHAQITKQVGGGTRQLQEGILDYVDKISTCFMKKNSHSFGQPNSVCGSYLVDLSEEEQKIEVKREGQEARGNSSEEVKEKKKEKNGSGNQVKERTTEQCLDKRREEKDVKKTKKKEEQVETKEAERGKKERLERGKTDGEVINNTTKRTEVASPRYRHQRSLQSQQASRQRKDNESIQAQTYDEEIRTDLQYRIDSNLAAACAKSNPNPNPNHETYSTTDSTRAQAGTPKVALRRRTCPNINFNTPSSVQPDT